MRFDLSALFNEINLVDILSQFHMSEAEMCFSLFEHGLNVVGNYKPGDDIDGIHSEMRDIFKKITSVWCNTLVGDKEIGIGINCFSAEILMNDKSFERYLRVAKDIEKLCQDTKKAGFTKSKAHKTEIFDLSKPIGDEMPTNFGALLFRCFKSSASIRNGRKVIIFRMQYVNIPILPNVEFQVVSTVDA